MNRRPLVPPPSPPLDAALIKAPPELQSTVAAFDVFRGPGILRTEEEVRDRAVFNQFAEQHEDAFVGRAAGLGQVVGRITTV